MGRVDVGLQQGLFDAPFLLHHPQALCHVAPQTGLWRCTRKQRPRGCGCSACEHATSAPGAPHSARSIVRSSSRFRGLLHLPGASAFMPCPGHLQSPLAHIYNGLTRLYTFLPVVARRRPHNVQKRPGAVGVGDRRLGMGQGNFVKDQPHHTIHSQTQSKTPCKRFVCLSVTRRIGTFVALSFPF